MQCLPISDHVTLPRVSFLCLTVVHEKTHEYGYNSKKYSYSNVTRGLKWEILCVDGLHHFGGMYL